MEEESTHYVAVKVNKHEYKHYQVPEPVWRYIRQLEKAITTENYDSLRKIYPNLNKNS